MYMYQKLIFKVKFENINCFKIYFLHFIFINYFIIQRSCEAQVTRTRATFTFAIWFSYEDASASSVQSHCDDYYTRLRTSCNHYAGILLFGFKM